MLPAAAAPFLAAPASGALLFDFDGTLSPIVTDPAAAAAQPGVIDLLAALADRYRRVGVVSGRPVAFLRAQVPDAIACSGLYGLESHVDGVAAEHAEAGAWRGPVGVAAVEARAAEATHLAGLVVEAKGLSITLHYRRHPELEEGTLALARELAARHGLEVRTAKMSVELHPPIHVDKGSAVEALAEGCTHVLFAGDDVGDLPAFDALDRLAARGVHVLRVVVTTTETAAALRARADLELPGTDAVPGLLHALLGDAP